MKEYIRSNQRVYDKLAEEYKKRLKDYIVSDRKIAAPFIDYLKEHFKDIKVLELGPGSGLTLSYFEAEGFDTTAIDISKEILKVSKEVTEKTNFILGNFLEYNFSGLKFEGIFAKAFIHLFKKRDAIKVIKKIKGLLVKGGIVFIATTVHQKSEEGFFEKKDYEYKVKRFRRKWTENELINLIEKNGLKIIDKRYNIEEDKNKRWINLVAIKWT